METSIKNVGFPIATLFEETEPIVTERQEVDYGDGLTLIALFFKLRIALIPVEGSNSLIV